MADNMTVNNGLFELPISITENGTITKTLQTQDTYLDKNIKVTVETPDATFERKTKAEGSNGEITATVSTTDTTYTSDTETDYAITIAADAHVNDVTVGVANAGFAASTDEITVDGADATQATKTIYVKAGTLSGSGSASAEGGNGVALTKVAEQPESGFYIKASGSGSVGVGTAGWVDSTTTTVSTDGDAYYTLTEAKLANSVTDDTGYTLLDTPVLTSEGYLYINEGYIEDTKISLATLVPDGTTLGSITDASDYMYQTIKAYDNDGVLVTGTMGDAALGDITANDAAATISSVTVAANGDTFSVTGSEDISGSTSVAVTTRGLATTDMTKSGVISGTASVNAQIAKIGLAVETSGNDGVVTPVIAKEDATTAKSNAITTTAPTTGHYIAVSTAAIKEDVTVSAKVATAGYGTTDAFNKTDGKITTGAESSGIYYVGIQDGSHTITEGTSDVTAAAATVSTTVAASDDRTVGGVLATAPTTGAYLTINGSATTTDGSVTTHSTCTVTEGYVTAETKNTAISETVGVNATAAATKYIKIYEGAVL